MPTYTVHARPGTFTAAQYGALAGEITRLHSEHTGAPRSFVQTVFLPVEPGAHFIGAEPAGPRSVWVYGHIRSGRLPAVRTGIAVGITAAFEAVGEIPRQFIWVYLNALAHTDMVEFGTVLPAPGDEDAWVENMHPDVREHLRRLG
jgi:phenylpyruvate tautomerase PptA (4-oxalocrotonate tautomerase family)